jgi:hypothetical protein
MRGQKSHEIEYQVLPLFSVQHETEEPGDLVLKYPQPQEYSITVLL